MAAAKTACVPHSVSTTNRTCGNAPFFSPRPDPGRPKNASLSSVSATSSVVPSTATTQRPRYQAPMVYAAVDTGRHTRANRTRSDSAPSRARAREIAPVEGTSHLPRHRPA